MNRLKELREDKDLKQKDIARNLNITQRNYSYYETSQTILNEDILQRLANYYNTSIDYIGLMLENLILSQLWKMKKKKLESKKDLKL